MTDVQTEILDVNLLLALSSPDHVHHEVAHQRFSQLTSWATTSATESGLLRLLLTEVVLGRQIRGADAIAQLRSLRRVPGWRFVGDDASLAEPVIDTRVLMGRKQVTDLQLVNLAATHAMVVATFDRSLRESLVEADQHHVRVWSTRDSDQP